MNLKRLSFLLLVCGTMVSSARAQVPATNPGGAFKPPAPPLTPQQLYDKVTPSLAAVQFTYESELGRRELICAGVIVREDGLVMFPLADASESFPDIQMKEFKVIVPQADADPLELDAVFQGRDERSNMAFVKAKESRPWKPIHFEDVELKVGDPVFSVGMLPKAASYKTYLERAMVSAQLRGAIKQVLVAEGALAAVGSPVFTADGKAIGFVNLQPERFLWVLSGGRNIGFATAQPQQAVWLNDKNSLGAITLPPRFFNPTKEFELGLKDAPTPDHPLKLPWLGVAELQGLKKDEAEYFGLTNQPAVQIGAIIPGAAADRAGLLQNDIIVKMNGQPLERGDEPAELPGILSFQLLKMKVGSDVKFTILRGKGQPEKEVTVTLDERPPRSNTANRFWAEDLGFGVRDLVFQDTYALHLPRDAKGLIVAVVKAEGSAGSARLRDFDVIQQLNGEPVTDLKSFTAAYKEYRKSHPHDAVVLVVHREAREETIRIEPPQ